VFVDAPDLALILQQALAVGTPGLGLVAIPQGTVFLQEDGLADVAWLLLEGRARVFRVSRDGDLVVLAHRLPGELIGELAVIDGGQRSGSAVALEPLSAIRIDAARFARLMAENTAFAHGVALQLAARLRETSDRTYAMAAAPIPARVAAELLRLARPGAVPGEAIIAAPPTITELSVRVHATRESVSKTFSRWRADGSIRNDGSVLVIVDPAALSDLLDF
jgi:CRP/FNR family transcriptional regulator, cyclic AMP receptor protein